MGLLQDSSQLLLHLSHSQTAKEEAGKMLGTLQMGSVSGHAIWSCYSGDYLRMHSDFNIHSSSHRSSVTIAAIIVLFGIKRTNKE